MAQTMTRKMTPSPTEGPTRTLTMLERLRAVRRVTVQENQRALVLKDGRFLDLLGPGRHEVSLRTDAGRFGELAEIAVHLHDLSRPEFVSPYETALFRERPDLVAAHLTEIRTSSDEVGVILRDGRIWAVQKPDGRSVVWTDAGPWTVERVDVSDDLAVERKLLRRLERFGPIDKVKRFTVDAEQAGLLFLDGAFARRLEPGAHAFWDVGRKVEVNRVDLRRHALDVTGQEILTKDRVSIRVNLAAEYRVADPEQAVSATTNYVDALYRALQYAFRKSLGAKTLDEILEQKVSVDAEVADKLRREMAEIGLEVREIALKDVILPGDMREILNRVVEAEKEAQANVIRRREETAATRSLLNTAKVMEENPIMLRLKELEALETISSRVDSLVVHNGPKGLLRDIARLGEREDD